MPVPRDENGLDWEGEVAAWVGADLTGVDADEARAAILGYSTFNDLTARIAQKLTSQWILGKNADRSGPIGPLVTADEVGGLRDGLAIRTRVNGQTVQESSTDRQIYEAGRPSRSSRAPSRCAPATSCAPERRPESGTPAPPVAAQRR